MKRASLDVGTNSVRLLIAEYKNGAFLNSEKYVQITQLGKSVNETKLLQEDRIKATVEAILAFKKKADEVGCDSIHIMATSAVRDAKNRDVFLTEVRDKAGLEVEVISGPLEAEIGFKGVLSGLENLSENQLVIDIGGGSTELIVGGAHGINFAVSIDIGAVRLTGAFVHKDPMDQEICDSIKAYVRGKVLPYLPKIKSFNLNSAIGIGGTAASFVTMGHAVETYSREGVHDLKLSLNQIKALNENLMALPIEARKKIIGLEEKRAEVILAGGLILQSILEMFKIETLRFSDYDNLEGFLMYCL